MREYEPGKNPQIKGLIPGLTEIGKIKIGRKGAERKNAEGKTWQLPEKVDHFIVTTLDRGPDNNFLPDKELCARLKLAEKPKEIPITLLFDDLSLNFQSRYVCYVGKKLACSGDGENAITAGHKIIPCPCPQKEPTYKGPDKCKMKGWLSCLITGAGIVGGVWKFRTTGYNSTVGIMSSLSLIATMTGGFLAGIPLRMRIMPKVATNPDNGQSVTIYVVGITFAGDMAQLQKTSLAIAQSNAEYRQRMIGVEDAMRKLISVDAEIVDQAGDINEEHYPPEPEEPDVPNITVTTAADAKVDTVVDTVLVKVTREGTPEPAAMPKQETAAHETPPPVLSDPLELFGD